MAANRPTTSEYSGLAYYIVEIIFKNFQENRKDLQLKWQQNIDDFNCVLTETLKGGESIGWRSKVVPPSTKIKVLSAYSVVIDMLLQGGKIPFMMAPSPWDNVVLDDLPDEQREIVEESINDATNKIEQQLQDCNGDRELMKSVFCKAIYGESISKRFVHEVVRKGFKKTSLAPEGLRNDGQFERWEPYQKTIKSPGVRFVSLWNIFRDLESDDLQAGVGIIERNMVSAYDLRNKMGQPFWIDSEILEALKEAPEKDGSQTEAVETDSLPPELRNVVHRQKTIQELECHVRVPRVVVEDFEKELAGNEGYNRGFYGEIDRYNDGDEIEIIATVHGKRVTRFIINPDDNRPYYRDIWEIKLDHAESTGIPDNNHQIFIVLTGMVRAFVDNKTLSANVLLAIKERYLPDFDKELIPGKNIPISDDCDDVRKALQQVVIQDVGETLLSAIGMFERYQDEVTMLPKISQGATLEKDKPDTLGEIQILQANAGKYLGGVIKNTDERWTEPVVNDFHQYNMADPDEQKGKGNFTGKALGFSSFQDRVTRLTKIMQGLNLVMSSEALMVESKLRDLLKEIWKALDIDPDQALKSREDKAEEQQAAIERQAQQEAQIKKIQTEQNEIEEQKKNADHGRKLEEIAAKGALEIEKQGEGAEDKLVLQDEKAKDDLVKQQEGFEDDVALLALEPKPKEVEGSK